MLLNKPALAISFSLEDTVQLIEDTIKSKYWHRFEVGTVKLIYIPYWIFSYDAFSESADEESKSKSVSEAGSGKMGLNAVSNELDEAVASLYEGSSLEETVKPDKKYPFEIQRPRIRDREAERIIPLKVAAMLGTTKDNIVISGLDMVYVPKWIAFVTVAEGTYRLEINAVTGEITNEEQVPARERGWLELTGETLQDLKRPGAWIEYSARMGSGVIYTLTHNQLIDLIKQNRQLQVVILIVIAVVVAIWAFR